jgi:preprotein translocase subunit SecD
LILSSSHFAFLASSKGLLYYNPMTKYRIGAIALILAGIGLSFFISSGKLPFKFGLDLVGGTELIYKADVSKVDPADVEDSLNALQDVIERRVNVFGVSEPIVQVERAGVFSGNPEDRLIVELPGFKNIEDAKASLGATPLLEFRLEKDGARDLTEEELETVNPDEIFEATELTGRFLKRAQVVFDQTTGAPYVGLEFNDEGREIFAEITKDNVGKILAIYLDGAVISAPVIQDEISDGVARITGGFSIEEAKSLVKNLNYGSLPVPIELVSTQSIGATLGEVALRQGVKAGIIGFLLIVLFMLVWYRLPGLVAVVALSLYVVLSLVMFQLFRVTLTAAGIAGFILSIGMAVDANILIFERMKEELKKGKNLIDATHEGFHRAWLSIRDSNISSIITAIVLFWLGTSAIKGFALTLGIGVAISMFTAITASRTFLFSLGVSHESKLSKFLFGSGFGKN